MPEMVRAYAKITGEQCCLQNYELGTARCETTGTSKEDMETADEIGQVGVSVDIALDHKEWRRRTRLTLCR